jgi:hypothetical protein
LSRTGLFKQHFTIMTLNLSWRYVNWTYWRKWRQYIFKARLVYSWSINREPISVNLYIIGSIIHIGRLVM